MREGDVGIDKGLLPIPFEEVLFDGASTVIAGMHCVGRMGANIYRNTIYMHKYIFHCQCLLPSNTSD